MSVILHPIKRHHLLILVALLIIASVPRLGDGLLMERFRYDHATLSSLALDMVYGGDFPLLGIQSSAGVPNSPMTVYLIAPFFALSTNPLVPMIGIALLNVLGVGLLWFIAHRAFGVWVGIVAGLAYALSPYAITYSRSIWAQNYHTPFIVLAMALAWLGFVERKSWAQALALPVLLVGLQVHFAAWTLLPIVAVWYWMGRKAWHWRAFGTSIILSALIMLPFTLGILSTLMGETNYTEGTSSRLDTVIALIGDGLDLRPDALHIAYHLTGGIGTSGAARDSHPLFQATMPYPDALAPSLVFLALLGAAGVLVMKAWRIHAPLVWAWAGLTIVIFIPAWTGTGIYHHYFVPTIPALMLMIGLGAGVLIHGLGRITRTAYAPYAVLVVLLPVFAFQGIYQVSVQRFVNDTYAYSADGTQRQTSPPIRLLLQVRQALADFDDVLILGANPHESNHYIWSPLLYDSAECVRDLQLVGGDVVVLPAGRFAVLLASPPEDYITPALYVNEAVQVIDFRPDEPPYTLYEHQVAPTWDGVPIVPITPVTFANGVTLEGYALVDDLMVMQWHLANAGDGVQYSYYGHFLDADGERIGQRDMLFYAPQFWCAGDRLITWSQATMPQTMTTLRVGMYILKPEGGTQPIERLDGAGTWVDIALP